MIKLKPHSVILFQGDSITDTGRSRTSFGPHSGDALGYGYVRLIANRLQDQEQDSYLQIYNRGVSGNRIRDMQSRWEGDSLRLMPDLLSILIGVNDTWNYLFTGLGSSPEEYHLVYHDILDLTRQRLPDIQLVLCEPFLLLTGEVSEKWEEDLKIRQESVRQLAGEFEAIHVPFQDALDEAAKQVSPRLLLDDGVHPTEKGHRVLEKCWMKAVTV